MSWYLGAGIAALVLLAPALNVGQALRDAWRWRQVRREIEKRPRKVTE